MIKPHDITAAERILGREPDIVGLVVKMAMKNCAGKIEQMAAQGASPVELFKIEYEAAMEIVREVRSAVHREQAFPVCVE